jgi:hypothetical protein
VVQQQGGGTIRAFTDAVAAAISGGGSAATEAYSQAFAQAAAAGGDQRSGLAQATATAFCEGAYAPPAPRRQAHLVLGRVMDRQRAACL